jgi:hypothetical protein
VGGARYPSGREPAKQVDTSLTLTVFGEPAPHPPPTPPGGGGLDPMPGSDLRQALDAGRTPSYPPRHPIRRRRGWLIPRASGRWVTLESLCASS